MALNEHLVVPTFFAAAAARAQQEPWVTLVHADGSEQGLTPEYLCSEVGKWSATLLQRGLRPGERVAICLDHAAHVYSSFLGVMAAGGVPSSFAPRSVKQKKDEQERIFLTLLAQSGCRFLICDDADFSALAADYTVIAPHIIMDDVELGASIPAIPPKPDDIAFIQYSSGTTGLKKGVGITHRMLLNQLDAYASSLDLTPRDRIASWLPLYHDMGLITAFFIPLLKGIAVIALSPFDWVRRPALLLTAIARHGATLCWQPNFAYKFLTRVAGKSIDLSSVRLWINCSEPVLSESHKAFLKSYTLDGVAPATLGACYAMAESVFAVTSTGSGPGSVINADVEGAGKRLLTSSGRPLEGVSVRILNPDFQPLLENNLGQIAVRTPFLFTHYIGDVRAEFREHHFLTGDTGFLSGGELYVLGREKDIIIVAGRNLYPQDIEAVVDDVPGVIPGRSLAFGVPDVALGTEGLVVVAESAETSAQSVAALSSEISRRILSLTDVAARDVRIKPHMWLAKTTSGKISRQLNRTRYLEEIDQAAEAAPSDLAASGPAPRDADTILDRVRAAVRTTILRANKNPGILADDESFFELGLVDSLSFIELLAELESAFGHSIPDAVVLDASNYNSILALATVIAAHPVAEPTAAPPSTNRTLADARMRRTELSPQFADSDRVALLPVPYIMCAPAGDFASPSANTGDMGFRLSFKDGARISRAEFANLSGEKGIVIGNSVSWGTGATHDTKVVHNALNELMPKTTWLSLALRQTTLTQERLAAELFAPLDIDHVVWITGSVFLSIAATTADHRNFLPYAMQRRFEKTLGGMPKSDKTDFAQRRAQMRVLLERELILLRRVFGSRARNLVFAVQPSLQTCGKRLHAAEQELARLFYAMPGNLKEPNSDLHQALAKLFRKDARSLCEKHGIAFVDMDEAPHFQTNEWLFVDPAHMNDAGHRVLAAIVMDHFKVSIRQRGLTRLLNIHHLKRTHVGPQGRDAL